MIHKLINLSAVLGLLLGLSAIANAQQKCSPAGIAGTWVVKCNGYLTPGPSAPMVPATLLAKAVSDKDGNWSASGTISLGGTIATAAVTSVGPVQVNPDCTGNIAYAQTINGQPTPDTHFNFIVSENDHHIDGISTDPGSIFSCTLARVSR